ncbi:MAG: ABC transporter ATP-binding protein [Verrucomicrobiae bacterium]|nr:ABC transporter ATP-binding protein [Verrucomicrobiae bacterium]
MNTDSQETKYPSLPVGEVKSRFFSFLKPYRNLIAGVVVGNVFTVFLAMLNPLAVKFTIDEAIPSHNTGLMIGIAATFAVLAILRYVVAYGHSYLQYYVGQKVVFDIRKTLFHHLQLLHLSFYEKEKSASLVNRVIYDVSTIQQFMNQSFSLLTNSGVGFFIALAIMSFMNWRLALWCLCTLPMLFVVRRFFNRRLYEKSHDVRERQSSLAGMLGETFSGVKVVKSFGQEDHERRRFVLTLRDNFMPEFDLTMLGVRMGTAIGLMCELTYATVLLLGGWSVFGGNMTAGDFVAFTGYLWNLFGPVQVLSGLIQVGINARTGFERILHILNTRPKVVEAANPVVLSNIKGRVVFNHVGFRYADRPTIQDFSLDVHPGEVIALVGSSGSGKSTVVSLLTRFHDVETGTILIDGVDLRHLDYDVYRRQIGIVLQDSFLFSSTIEENIRYGKPEATIQEVREAARMANALDFIDEMPEGLKTPVNQGGTLSGGQRQRIGIARAILKNPRILIFDEATSALDTESERLILQSLDYLMKGKTVFIVAHRLSTVRKANRIVVMDKGAVVEIGSHEELMMRNGPYSRLQQPRVVGLPEASAAA